MNNFNDVNDFENNDLSRSPQSPQSPPPPQSQHQTIVLTQSKEQGIRNEVCLKMRNTEFSVSGWKACALEFVVIGLAVSGTYFLAKNAPDTCKSVFESASNYFNVTK